MLTSDSSIYKKLENKAKEKFGKQFEGSEIAVSDFSIVEQASSSATAKFTSSLVPKSSVVADLTAGLGVNTIYFSNVASRVYAIEKDAKRANSLIKNLDSLGINNVKVVNEDCSEWLTKFNVEDVDVIFLDPARRNDQRGKLVKLEDCSPNIIELYSVVKEKCKKLLVKCSPLLDIKEACRVFPDIKHIYILEYKREVRELLLEIDILKDSTSNDFALSCVRLKEDGIENIATFSASDFINDTYAAYLKNKAEIETGGFIYEPSPAFMKAACWNWIHNEYGGIYKLSANTHLFFSNNFYPKFPGRIFEVKSLFQSKDLKKIKGEAFNVISRNHPAKADEIKERYKLKPSEDKFLIACTVGREKSIIQSFKLFK